MEDIITIDDGYNTDYLTSLLIALFHKISYFDCILVNKPSDSKIIYMQEILRYKFVDKIRNNISVLTEVINEIKLSLVTFEHYTYDNLIIPKTQHDICNLYNFLATQTGVTPIEKYNDTSYIINLESNEDTSIKELLNKWYSTNKLINIPLVVCINMIHTKKIDIQHKIKLSQYGPKWKIHSIICKGENYYSILNNGGRFILFNDKMIPSIQYINMKNMAEQIKEECIMAFYTYIEIGYEQKTE